MPRKLDLDDYKVKPGCRASLADWKPDDDGGFTKPDGEARLADNLVAVDELQMKFWANRSRAMLVVLQGIDTAGKDGVIRKVMTALNPQGVSVHSFKKPPTPRLRTTTCGACTRAAPEGARLPCSTAATTRT